MNEPPANPTDAPRLHARGDDLQRQGRLEAAVACYRQALDAQPTQVQSLNNLALALQRLGHADEAIASLRQALVLRPADAAIETNLGNLLNATGQHDAAIACYERSLRTRPADADTLTNLAATLRETGRVTDAIACYRVAVAAHPGHAVAHSGLLYTLHFDQAQTRHSLAAEHRRWNDRHAAGLAGSASPHRNSPDRDRPLRVGYVSPNFFNHPVGRFLLPLLAGHDRKHFDAYCYSDTENPDAMTTQLRGHTHAWRVTNGLSDECFAAAVRADRVDVLVDLNLHMARGRQLAFARRPAPVQMTYLAYASTSGMRAIDYRISDTFMDPEPLDPADYAEQTLRLPRCYWCYRPAAELPDVSPLPAQRVGHVTFGCLNNFCKVSPSAIATWAAILRELPDTRLRLHAHAGTHRTRCERRFADLGVDPSRLEWVGFLPIEKYLEAYREIDIALDPFPYAGGTTTCDALWMGVPVVSLVGATAVARSGLSILTAVGLSGLATTTTAAYIGAAVSLAGDLPSLVTLRASLRKRVAASMLADARQFVLDIEGLYRTAWTQWCDDRTTGHSTI